MTEKHATIRVRHETVRRSLTVKTAEKLTPGMVRVVLGGEALAGFVSAGFDDHIKLFFPDEQGAAPLMRDFTPRRYDAAAGELTIDFALHEAGPATAWAAAASGGTSLDIGGPRGSAVIPDDFDWYLLIGDETAVPAIGRRLEELRPDARVIVVGAVAGPEEHQSFQTRALTEVHWVHRSLGQANDPAPLLDAVTSLALPEGEGHIWIAGESGTSKVLRQHLVEERGHNPAWIKAAGYWRAGAPGVHETHAG